MKRALGVAVACSLLCGPALAQLAEYGIEGIWTVSTRDAELRGSVSPDGKRMVWGSDRGGGPGGGDLWQARSEDKRWLDPQPLPFNTPALEAEPTFSADGRWLYFVSDRAGGEIFAQTVARSLVSPMAWFIASGSVEPARLRASARIWIIEYDAMTACEPRPSPKAAVLAS